MKPGSIGHCRVELEEDQSWSCRSQSSAEIGSGRPVDHPDIVVIRLQLCSAVENSATLSAVVANRLY